MSDFFNNSFGSCRTLDSRPQLAWRFLDAAPDLRLVGGGDMARLRKRALSLSRRRVLIVGIEVPKRAADIHAVLNRLQDGSRHDIQTSVVAMGDRGKFANIDLAVQQAPPLSRFDWLVVADDDIAFAPGFLDDLLAAAEATPLSLLQPAHAFQSHTSFAVTRRRWGLIVDGVRSCDGPTSSRSGR